MAKGKEPVDDFSVKIDMCLTDGIVKTGGGLVLGSLASLLFLGRRKWPILTGIGMGMGIAYANYKGFKFKYTNNKHKWRGNLRVPTIQ